MLYSPSTWGIVCRLAADLDPTNYDRAVEIASLPDLVRGYGDIKLANVDVDHAGFGTWGSFVHKLLAHRIFGGPVSTPRSGQL